MPENGNPGSVTPDLALAAKTLEDALAEFQQALRKSGLVAPPTGPLFVALREWRSEQARTKQMPPYIIATDRVLRSIELAKPKDVEELAALRGVGKSKASLYGTEILEIVARTA